MAKKVIIFLLLALLIIPTIVAQPPFQASDTTRGLDMRINEIEYLKQNDPYKVHIHVYNVTTGGKIDNSSTVCRVDLYNRTGSHVFILNASYSLDNEEFELAIAGDNFSIVGTHPWIVECQYDDGGEVVGAFVEGMVVVNPIGVELTTSSSIIYIGLLGILIFTFLITFFGIGLLPAGNQTDEDGTILSITWLKYLRETLWFTEWMLLVAIFFVSSNLAFAFLGETLFADLLFAFFSITLGLSPVILTVWLVHFFIMIWRDKELRAMMNKGMMGGNI